MDEAFAYCSLLESITDTSVPDLSGLEYKSLWRMFISCGKLEPCLFNLYAENIMRNARLDEAQAGIKIAGRNINSLRYADDT